MARLNTGSLSNYSVTQTLYEGSRTLVYRAIRPSDERTVAIKSLRSKYPSFEAHHQFRNQNTIGHTLDHPGLVRMESLVTYVNGQAIFM